MRLFTSFLPRTTAAAAIVFVFSFSGDRASAQQQQQQVTDLPLTHSTCLGMDLGGPVVPGVRCRGITKLRGDLYRVQADRDHLHFYVTPEGVIVLDPTNVETSTWLKAEIAQRFKVPVKYVVYSHGHWDHASGAKVFADTAEIWAHANTSSVIDAETKVNADRMKDVMKVQKTYTDRQTITLGGRRVELIHPASANHTTDNTMMYLPAEKVLVAIDFVLTRRAFAGGNFTNPGEGTPDDWIRALKGVEALDFDIVSPAHSQVGTKADVVLFRQYVEDLMAEVTAGFKAGKTVEQLQAAGLLSKYAWVMGFENARKAHIANAYKYLQTRPAATR